MRMLWRAVWLTMMVAVATSAVHNLLVSTIDHDPLQVNNGAAFDDPVSTNDPSFTTGRGSDDNVRENYDDVTVPTTPPVPECIEDEPGCDNIGDGEINNLEDNDTEGEGNEAGEGGGNGGGEGGGNGGGEGGGNGGGEGGGNGGGEGGGNGGGEGDDNGGGEGGDNGGGEGGGNGGGEGGNNGGGEGGDNGGGEGDGNGGGEGGDNGGGEGGDNGGGGGGDNGGGEGGDNGGGEGDSNGAGAGEGEGGGNGVGEGGGEGVGEGGGEGGGVGEGDGPGEGVGDGDDNGDGGGGGGGADQNGNGDNDDPDNNASDETIGLEELIIETKSGRVQGYHWQGNENIISYIDIPYGTITNAFQAAGAANTWDIHTIREHDKRCPQLEDDNYVGNIDCLTLSIFKPAEVEDASVLFHIHGDNFETGSGDPFVYGPEYLVEEGIILVLPNYRLGPLGFLCMQNETAPGNMALKDLSLALSWISDNIEAFGGDAHNIAVSGDGRSGALAGLLALSPMSKVYVSKVIAESGSFLSYWALDRDPLIAAGHLMERLAELDNTASRIDISFRDSSIESILTAAKGLEFRPCLERDNSTAFMIQSPYQIVTSENMETASFLMGSAKFAGTHEALMQTAESIQKLNDDSTLLLPDDLIFTTMTLRTQTGARVKRQYFGERDITLEDVKDLSVCFTDMGYLGPGIRSARLLAEAGANVYFYEFSFVGEMNRVLDSINHPVEGAVRGDIIGYLFTQDGVVPSEQQTDETKMIETMTQIWTSFLKTGSPATEQIEWSKLENNNQLEEEWLLIGTEVKMSTGVHVDRLPLWTEIYENHYIDGNHGPELSPSVYTILIFQIVFWVGFCKNASHLY